MINLCFILCFPLFIEFKIWFRFPSYKYFVASSVAESIKINNLYGCVGALIDTIAHLYLHKLFPGSMLSPEVGKELFKRLCAHCHSIKDGEPHKYGPNLARLKGKPLMGQCLFLPEQVQLQVGFESLLSLESCTGSWILWSHTFTNIKQFLKNV